VSLEGAAAEMKADEELKAQWEAEREKRSKAARKGWRRYREFFEEQRRWRAEGRRL
jgi:hypothetical protein